MTITLLYSGQARTAAGRSREQLALPDGAGLVDVLADLTARYGDAMRGVLPALLIFVNDDQIDRAAPRALRDGDQVTLLSPIAGG